MTYEQACDILKDEITANGELSCGAPYLFYSLGESASLDGLFDATDLEAIAVFMRHSQATAAANSPSDPSV